ncbi:LapA family protein [Neisseria sp. CCUG12390]|uniref:LapA family protein n=1 Tax=Neisseria sp. CCUG12390 TaxID=3392035 RepID=UPI003A101735
MKIVYLIIKILILLVFLLLAVSNTQVVSFFYLPGQSVELPLIVVLFGAFVIGILFGIFALFGRLLGLRSEANRLRAEVKKHGRMTEQDIQKATPSALAVTPAANTDLMQK